MSRIQDPHKAFFPFGNPFRMILPKGSSLSPKLMALLEKFEETLDERLKKLKPMHKDDVFSFSWMVLAMQLLSETHSDIKSLITDLELPVYDWDDKWIDVYLDNSVKLLDICIGLSSELSRMSQGQLLLHLVLRNLEGKSSTDLLKAKSSIDSWGQHIASGNGKIENCIPIIDKLMESLELPKIKSSAKGKVLRRAMYGVKMVTLFVCSIFVSAFSGSDKKLIDLQVCGTPLWGEAFINLRACVYGEIRNSLSSGRNVLLKELEAVDISLKEVYPILQESKEPVDFDALQKSFTDLGKTAGLSNAVVLGFEMCHTEVMSAAVNSQTGEEVAIKKVTNAFDNRVDAKRTLREIKLLRHMIHDNVIALRDIIRPPQKENFNDVYIVYELMDTDLHQIIRSNQSLTDDHCRYFLYQILRGLKYVHSANVLHRDLKPSNLFLNANCDLKIGDFGLARATSETDFMTEYVVTRWYRAPELLLNCSEYTAAIDIWSVGCILGEILTREPLFPGKDYVHQLKLITELIGAPDDSSLGFLRNDNARKYVKQLPQYPRQQFSIRFPNASPMAVDLLERMLVFDPNERITVNEALCHPYLAPLHDINEEPVCFQPFSFDFEQPSFTEENIKELIWRESVRCNPDPAIQ